MILGLTKNIFYKFNHILHIKKKKKNPKNEKIFTFENHPTHYMIQRKELILPL